MQAARVPNGGPFLDLGLLVLRLFVGIGLLAHGIPKLIGTAPDGTPAMVGFTRMVAGFGFPGPPELWAWAAVLTEVVGGPLLVVGLLTRLVAVAGIIHLSVAILKVRAGAGWIGGWELEMLYIGTLVTLLFTGAGRFSLDGVIRTRRHGRWI